MNEFEDNLFSIQSEDELESLKHQLFKENVRIQAEKNQLEFDLEDIRRQKKQVAVEKKQLQREKRQLSLEMNELRQQVEYQRKRLKDDEKQLDKKQKLLEYSYEMLNQDKENLSKEMRRVEMEKETARRMTQAAQNVRKEVYATGLFFRGVNNVMALKKRYKDLLKIYHPDNICGDQEILLKINKEYEELRSKFE